jgi:hypothetical protein
LSKTIDYCTVRVPNFRIGSLGVFDQSPQNLSYVAISVTVDVEVVLNKDLTRLQADESGTSTHPVVIPGR